MTHLDDATKILRRQRKDRAVLLDALRHGGLFCLSALADALHAFLHLGGASASAHARLYA
jgi:hypothetical protein